LEQLARSQKAEERPRLSLDIKVERGAAPDAGFAASIPSSNSGSSLIDVLSPADEPLTLEELLSAAALRLRHYVPFDSLAFFIPRHDVLCAQFAIGENIRQLSALRVPMGEGLVGWIAETGNSIVNGNPTVEPGLEKTRNLALRSALGAALQRSGTLVGVLAVYALQADAFTPEHLALLQATGEQLSAVLEEKIAADHPVRSSVLPDWRHQSGHARRRSVGERRPAAQSALTSVK
jgi:putative methionine-R-sulfoxide reductase with GAF domain